MKEMFLAKGFDDFLTKPIEISKLDEIMARWIPKEKREMAEGARHAEEPSLLSIPGVDTKKGISMTGGTESGYRKVLAQFSKDAAERIPVFAEAPAETTLATFAIQAHAIKSAAGTIGAAEVAAEAAKLEAAGKAGDIAAISETLPLFRERLTELIKEIRKVLEEQREETEARNGNQEALTDSLSTLRTALEAKNMKAIDDLLEKIETTAVNVQTRELINAVSEKVLMGEYEEAIALLTLWSQKNRGAEQAKEAGYETGI
jgi:HPt (histidine-containing phosphotransfer) domain-containing protein